MRLATSIIGRLLYAAVFLAAMAVGIVFAGPIAGAVTGLFKARPQPQGEPLYWVSPMDPNVHYGRPGKDSMGMELVPVYPDQQPPKPVMIDPELQERNYTTAIVERGPLVRTIRAVSTVAYAEPLLGNVTLKVDAWLEKLFVDYEGESVKKGDPLFDVYAPDIVAAQEELLSSQDALEDARRTGNQAIIQGAERNLESVRVKFRYWDVTEDQIQRMEREREAQKTVRYFSPFAGIVIKKEAFEGRYVPAGQMLYQTADLSKVWVYLYVYQNQIHCVYEGQPATFTLADAPNQQYPGKVTYIYPYLEPKVRAVKVRLEFENPDLVLKPDMFGEVALAPHEMGTGLKVPEQAVLNTGIRELVYIARPGGRFEPREVQTGMELDGGMVEVLSGLMGGERIVTSEDFIIDSESRLRLVGRKFEPAGMQPMHPAERAEPGHSDHRELPARPHVHDEAERGGNE